MSAALPPVPDLIPISALRKGSNRSNSASSDYSGNYTPSNNGTYYGDDSADGADSIDGVGALVNNNNDSDCEEDVQVKERAPCGSTQCSGEVMGEQRSRRTKQPTAAEVIDTPRSRGRDGAAPGASRKTERHRKSDRRRDRDRDRERRKRSNSSKRLHHNNAAAAASDSSHAHNHHNHHHHAYTSTSSSSCSDTTSSSPRVNPIFVWVRQKDTHIVEVKCEDYDKRNRILLTKTAQGWRAIPRTETLAPVLQKDDASGRYCKKSKRRSNSRPKRKSFGVQVDENELQPHPDATWSADDSEVTSEPPTQQDCSPPHLLPEADVNNRECSASAVSVDTSGCASAQDDCQNNISPLDNLLAVAELEFNQQIEAERWETTNSKSNEQEDFDMFIESCNASTTNGDKINDEEDCEIDYNDDDDNNLAMDDILSRLEQSLQSPDNLHSDIDSIIKQDLETIANDDNQQVELNSPQVIQDEDALIEPPETPADCKPEVECLHVLKEEEDVEEIEAKPQIDTIEIIEAVNQASLASPEVDLSQAPEVEIPEEVAIPEEPESTEETPTDLRVHTTKACDTDEDLIPTDLSIPKCQSSPQSKRPASQNSETIQSPQPSGIPAVPPSPDLYSANKNNAQSNSKSNIYLESLLSPTKDAIVLPEKEPLDLGKLRESDSPKVTCSQEEPPSKKIKLEDITLKTLLDTETGKDEKPQQTVHSVTNNKASNNNNKNNNNNAIDTPRLLELLTQEEEEMDPVAQLKQVLSNNTFNIPDPMLIPKDRLSQILSAPAKEIPKLLKQRPELRLPEALAFPHLLQDPDILVITLSQLKLIVEKQSQSLPVVEKEKFVAEKEKEKPLAERERHKLISIPEPRKSLTPSKEKPPVASMPNKEIRDAIKEKETSKKSKISELSSDIDAATNAAFSQMMWLPYLNQMEAMNNPEFLKFLSTMMPGYVPPDMSHMMRPFPPPAFPLPQTALNYNPLELSMWQESMLQQARTKNQIDFLNSQKMMSKNAMSTNSSPSPMNSLHSSYQHQFQQPNVPRSLPQQYQPPSTNHQTPKYPSKSKSSTSYQQSKQNTYHHQSHPSHHRDASQRKYDNEKLLQQQIQQQQQQLQLQRQKQQQAQQAELHRQEFLKQQELLKQQQEMYHKPKVACKPFANLVQPHLQLGLFPGLSTPPSPMQQQLNHQQQIDQYRIFQQQQQQFLQQQQQQQQQHSHQQQPHPLHEKRNRVSQGPIDLSGGPPTGKLKVKQPQHLVDPKNAARLLKYDDIAEVGSTTSSIDEMQEAQKHLWHPLFAKKATRVRGTGRR
ncbi:titin isoform X2 [Atheta coriaria]|uniref:titin isoform X2 n=1 Tax=Dalotia coriaria TaxID=877792 RepID=UPI0031F38B2B